MSSPLFLVLCGPSGCGKSTLAARLRQEFGADRCQMLSTDHYYRDLSHMSLVEREFVNFDRCEAIDRELLVADLQRLAAGQTVSLPRYDFVTHTRLPERQNFPPAGIVLVEGIFAAALLEGSGIPAFVIYLDVPVGVCLERRVMRDQAERGRTREEVETRFRQDILPSLQEIVLPQKAGADLVLDGTREPGELCAEVMKVLPTGAAASLPRPHYFA